MGSFDLTKLPLAKNEPSAFELLTPTGTNPVNCFSKTGYRFATEPDFAQIGPRKRKTKFVVLDDRGSRPKGSKIRKVVKMDRDRSDGRRGSNVSVEIPTSKVYGPNDGLFRRNDSSTVRGVQAFGGEEKCRGPGLLERVNRNPYKVGDGPVMAKNRIKHLMAENSKIKNIFRTVGSKLG
jgi:hypothetical protein